MPLNRVPAPIMMTPIIKLFSSPNLLVKRDVSRDAVENASNGRVVRMPIWVCDIPRSFCIRPKMAPTLVRPGRRLKEIRMIPKNNNTLVRSEERRVGKECRSRGAPKHEKNKKTRDRESREGD